MILVFSDTHWAKNRAYLSDVFDWIVDRIQVYRPKAVVFCGDLNHTHGHIDIDVLDLMVRSMHRVIDAAEGYGKVYLVSGNHDQASRDASENVLTPFQVLSGVTCATTEPVSIELPYFQGVLCPYPPNTPKEREVYFDKLNSIAASATRKLVAFTHWELTGVAYGPVNPKTSDHGVKAPAAVSLVVNGHYHHPAQGEGYVIVGSPTYHNYSDSLTEEPRGILLLDENGYRREECPVGPVYHTCGVKDVHVISQDPRLSRMMLRIKVDTVEEYEEIKADVIRLRSVAKSVRVVGSNAKVAKETQVLEGAVTDAPSLDFAAMLSDVVTSCPSNMDRAALLALGTKFIKEYNENP